MLAWLTSRNTVYTITNKRVVMRIGIVLSVTFNLPLRVIGEHLDAIERAVRHKDYALGEAA